MFFRKVIDKLQTLLSRLFNRCYELHMRKRLKNQDFTILCSNCIGGTIYHRLGLQFRSPTVNLWMHQRDFLQWQQIPTWSMENCISSILIVIILSPS